MFSVKAQIVAKSLQPVLRLCDLAERYDIQPYHLSDCRRYACQGLFAFLSDLMDALNISPDSALPEPTFVPLSILSESVGQPVPLMFY